MIGGKIERVIHLGPEGLGRDEDGEYPFANTIKLIVADYKGSVRPKNPDRCAVHVEPGNYEIEVGDKAWWQGGTVYWTKPNSAREDVPLRKVGFSYSGESVDKPFQRGGRVG